MTRRGSIPTGPSEQYLRLVKGEITPDEYRASVKDRIAATKRGGDRPSSRSGASAQHAPPR
jgi:hypothetical protein